MAFTATTVNSDKAWAPDLHVYSATDVLPTALILQCSTVAGRVEGDAPIMRVAYVNDDEAVIKAEGSELDEGEPSLSEALVYTSKITQLVRLSREQYSQDQTADQLAQSVARAITRRADLAFVAEAAPVGPAVAPVAGLVNVASTVTGDEITDDLDPLIDLVAQLEDNLATPTHILLSPLSWAAMRKLRIGSDYNVSLLGAGTNDAAPMLLSLPVVVNPAVPDFTGIVLDRNAIVSAVGPVQIATSMDQYFSSDSVALRATWRTGHVVTRPDRLGVFSIAAPGS